MKEIWHRHKTAILFLFVFISIYLVFNTIYGFYIDFYSPDADPITYYVAKTTVILLNLIQGDFASSKFLGSIMVPIFYKNIVVLDVFEGCNGINVIIVFIAFIFAFKGPLNWTLIYFIGGIALIILMNLIRLVFLTEVALNFPDYFFFVHKYLFTGFIYTIVFVVWYFWVLKVQKLKNNGVE